MIMLRYFSYRRLNFVGPDSGNHAAAQHTSRSDNAGPQQQKRRRFGRRIPETEWVSRILSHAGPVPKEIFTSEIVVDAAVMPAKIQGKTAGPIRIRIVRLRTSCSKAE